MGKDFYRSCDSWQTSTENTYSCTHNPLRNQWAAEVKKHMELQQALLEAVGLILAALWLLATLKVCTAAFQIYVENLNRHLGREYHVSSPTFFKVIDSNYARYKIGLSGTIERKDGKHVVFRDYFGQKVIKPPKENYMTPSILVYRSEVRFMDGSNIPWANKVTQLAYNEEYLHTVAMLAAFYAEKGHRVLVVSDQCTFYRRAPNWQAKKCMCYGSPP